MRLVRNLFPQQKSLNDLQQPAGDVDILVGIDYYGLHPKTEVASAGENLSIMAGPFGRCLHGSHPQLIEFTTRTGEAGATMLCRSKEAALELYIKGEEIGTEINPPCGSCRCGKCPVPGNTYSFQEEQELRIIRDNLTYCQEKGRWIAKYPWQIDPGTLPDNYYTVRGTLTNTEKVLSRKGAEWRDIYSQQIADMVERGVARKLSEREMMD